MRQKRIRGILYCVAILLILTVVYGYSISMKLICAYYTVKADVEKTLRIVHLSDLHNTEFGDDNINLIDLVKEQKPDLIVMSGDMLNRDDNNINVMLNLISSLKDVAPVYFGYGNHEYAWEKNWKKNLRYELESAGAVVVNNDYVDLDLKGSQLRIGGYMGYYRQPHMLTKNKYLIRIEKEFAEDFENTDRIKLLINHIPTQWLDWHYIDKYPVDVIFSGHYHGGAVRIPLIDRGVFAPYVGWFPPYTKGMFTGDKATCILSAGLGSEYSIPRLNNPPEIVVVDLIPE